MRRTSGPTSHQPFRGVCQGNCWEVVHYMMWRPATCLVGGGRNASGVAEANHPITTNGVTHPESPNEPQRQRARNGFIYRVQESTPMTQDINVLALVKGSERYVFLYDDASRAETLRVLGRYASNPELSFTWYDAAVLSQKIRQESQKQAHAARFDVPLATDQDEFS